MRPKYFAWLAFLVLFVAFIDSVQDPPAINLHNGSCRISALRVGRTSTPLEEEWVVASGCLVHIDITWLSFIGHFDNDLVGVCPIPLVRHAADPSPPLFS
jgi:hypothetical protein